MFHEGSYCVPIQLSLDLARAWSIYAQAEPDFDLSAPFLRPLNVRIHLLEPPVLFSFRPIPSAGGGTITNRQAKSVISQVGHVIRQRREDLNSVSWSTAIRNPASAGTHVVIAEGIAVGNPEVRIDRLHYFIPGSGGGGGGGGGAAAAVNGGYSLWELTRAVHFAAQHLSATVVLTNRLHGVWSYQHTVDPANSQQQQSQPSSSSSGGQQQQQQQQQQQSPSQSSNNHNHDDIITVSVTLRPYDQQPPPSRQDLLMTNVHTAFEQVVGRLVRETERRVDGFSVGVFQAKKDAKNMDAGSRDYVHVGDIRVVGNSWSAEDGGDVVGGSGNGTGMSVMFGGGVGSACCLGWGTSCAWAWFYNLFIIYLLSL